jgi:malate dehydrogenase (oxaloacetate-decarboxylating)
MKTFSFKIDPLTGEEYYEVYVRGQQLLNDPLLNKASAFSDEERHDLDLAGLLRPGISHIDTQMERSLEMYHRKADDLERYIYLQALLDRNETLFYKLLGENLTEMVPIVYTPTVGTACQQLSHITRRYRGIYISPENISNIDDIFQNIPLPQVSLIVVTDGERILGLGDLGSDGMGIPVGKVNLYVAAGGLHPACCLPITLDVGTNNERLLRDPLYLGHSTPRLTGKPYDDFVERFVLGVKRNFPGALIQWEDFAKHKAFTLLDRYRDRVLSFDDDIQGTGATCLSALMTAMKIKKSTFKEQRFVIVGAGQAGVGIMSNIRTMLREEGLADDEIQRRIFAIDQPGLLFQDTPGLEDPQRPFAQPRAAVATWKLDAPNKVALMDVVKNAKATVLIGVTARPGLFSKEILEQMAQNDERPVILPMSNPTAKSECTPEEVAKATEGKGLVATGSPFAPVEFGARRLVVSQCNNTFVFPGVGLGALVSKSPKVTDAMFLAASKALSCQVTSKQRQDGHLLPEVKDIRRVSREVAKAVCIQAREDGLGRLLEDDEIDAVVTKAQWQPHYCNYRAGKNGNGK